MARPVTNSEVALAWAEGREATNHRGSFATDGEKIFSYSLQIGDTLLDGRKVVKDYTARGSYGFKSQTTSCHVGILRYIPGHSTIVA